jgi:hypothetical protein
MSEPELFDLPAAAEFLGCSETAVLNLERRGRLSPQFQKVNWLAGPIRAHRYARRYTRAQLEETRRQREQQHATDNGDGSFNTTGGRRLNLKKAAPVAGVSVESLRHLLANWRLPGEQVAVEKMAPVRDGPPEDTILESDAVRVKKLIEAELRRAAGLKGHEDRRQLARTCGIEDLHELRECLACWMGHGLLAHQKILRRHRRRVNLKKRGHEIERESLIWVTVFNVRQFRRLWDADFVPAGKKLLKDLLADGPCDATLAKKRMAEAGIVGARLRRVRTAAKVRVRRGRGSEPHTVYEQSRAAGAKSPAEVLRPLFDRGPVPARAGLQQARALGLTAAEVYQGLRDLGVPLRSGGDDRQPHHWSLPAREQVHPQPAKRGRPAGKKAAKHAEIVADWLTGTWRGNISALARKYGIDRTTASKVLKAAGVRNLDPSPGTVN